MKEKICYGCGKLLALTKFSPCKTTKDGRVSACRVCKRAKARRVYQIKKFDYIKYGIVRTKKEEREVDLLKVLNIMEKANRALLKVLTDGDKRDQIGVM
ncbi:hypothetical protein LCGC14_1741330 [marine sediment metagenome]|uniref:Uncharacterized protein n=1 Tax=marine sediment metagenome TaxID=412755 RepID=A0A0F9HU74_9ZZZZ